MTAVFRFALQLRWRRHWPCSRLRPSLQGEQREDKGGSLLRGRQESRDRGSRPRRAEVRRGAGRDQGVGRLPHRRVHALGRRSRRPVPGDLRPRRRGRGGRCRAGHRVAEEGRPRDPALHARMPRLQILPVGQDQPLHRHPLDPGPGRDARRHLALFAQGQEGPSLHGLLDLLELHGAARDRAGQDPVRRAVRQGLLHRLRRHHRHRRGDQHRQGRGRRQRRGVRPGRHRAERRAGRAHGRRQHDRGRRSQSRARGARPQVRHDPLRQSRRRSGPRTSSPTWSS